MNNHFNDRPAAHAIGIAIIMEIVVVITVFASAAYILWRIAP